MKNLGLCSIHMSHLLRSVTKLFVVVRFLIHFFNTPLWFVDIEDFIFYLFQFFSCFVFQIQIILFLDCILMFVAFVPLSFVPLLC